MTTSTTSDRDRGNERRVPRRLVGAAAALGLGGALLAALASCLPDVNEDGVRVLALVGDSNTAAYCWVTEPTLALDWCFDGSCPAGCNDPSTGGRIAAGLAASGIVVRNYAVPGTGWQRGGEHSCEAQIQAALAEEPRPDGVLLTCGTNNLGELTAEQIVGYIEAGRQAVQAGGAIPFVATVPRRVPASTDPKVAAIAAAVEANVGVNNRVDWHTGFDPTDPTCYWPDGVHLFQEACQQERADRVIARILDPGA